MRWRWLALPVVLLSGGVREGLSQTATDRFDHWEHRRLFPSCVGCHEGVIGAGRALWPDPESCAACHEGTIEEKVNWRAPLGPPRTNLRFTHGRHAQAVREDGGRDSALTCEACHSVQGERMRVRLALVQSCLDCHQMQTAHLEAPDSSCATCHVTLAQASRLTRKDVAEFPEPESHRRPGFAFDLHGDLARPETRGVPVSAACATCHARDFCAECHVNAPEVPVIQALASDPRSTAQRVKLTPPANHHDPDFLTRHGGLARKAVSSCATCHTQESCLACHSERTTGVEALPVAGPGRGKGATVGRKRPESHGSDFSDIHGPAANTRPRSCQGCHVQPQCLDCHRLNPPDPTPGYHPVGFLSRHPAAAYSQETTCGDCHNTGQFCADCHVRSGLSARGPLDAGYHDAKRSFLLGHGQAARQNLESCVACHGERDCLSCHSANGSRRFNPHGPGFDPATLRRKNSQTCTVCHGSAIPDASP
ncbi:MAG TPA: hypothetical protein VFZ87_11370 [Gemmatimonadales bacterium]